MILTTTPTIEGRKIAQYLGLVMTGELKLDGRTNSVPERFYNLEDCANAIEQKAKKMHADAVVGITVTTYGDYEVGSHVMLGTAVKLK